LKAADLKWRKYCIAVDAVFLLTIECGSIKLTHKRRTHMQWTTPAFTDLRFGFEITMYIANR
jgi:coenzyme PQQ precursor peptide PqqA